MPYADCTDVEHINFINDYYSDCVVLLLVVE